MTDLEQRIGALTQLGAVMRAVGAAEDWPGHGIGLAEAEYRALDGAVQRARQHNGWAVEREVRHALGAFGEALRAEAVWAWAGRYTELGDPRDPERIVGLVLAGNIPLVGLHDVLCVWLSGHRARVKCSSQEPELVPMLVEVLDRFMPGTAARIVFVEGKLGQVDAVIATGSDNTARYFEHYFGHVPRIVRRSRVSVALLDGTETDEDLNALGEDVFRYFGLGCRNVSKLLLPRDFDLDRVFKAFYPWNAIAQHNKYGNNYDYTRALWLLDRVPFLENGFLLLKEDTALASPVSTLFYERFDDRESAAKRIQDHRDKIQCVVGHGHVPFGMAQQPELWEYADGVDTISFLLGLD